MSPKVQIKWQTIQKWSRKPDYTKMIHKRPIENEILGSLGCPNGFGYVGPKLVLRPKKTKSLKNEKLTHIFRQGTNLPKIGKTKIEVLDPLGCHKDIYWGPFIKLAKISDIEVVKWRIRLWSQSLSFYTVIGF